MPGSFVRTIACGKKNVNRDIWQLITLLVRCSDPPLHSAFYPLSLHHLARTRRLPLIRRPSGARKFVLSDVSQAKYGEARRPWYSMGEKAVRENSREAERDLGRQAVRVLRPLRLSGVHDGRCEA